MRTRRPAVALLLLGTAVLGACGDRHVTSALPFGLRQVAGTSPVGRPAVYDDMPFYYGDQPARARTLRATYRVTGDDPTRAFEAWVDQLSSLHLGRLFVSTSTDGGEAGRWMGAYGSGSSGLGPSADSAELELWATDAEPLLLVTIRRFSEEGPPTEVRRDTESPSLRRAPSRVPPRWSGAVLFEEQGDAIRLPARSSALMPTVPVSGGTGGSWSIFAAPDGGDALQALLDQASAASPDGEITVPLTTDVVDAARIHRTSFVISAGGWGFDAVAIEAPGDRSATVYVQSYAD